MPYARFKSEEELLKSILCSLSYDLYPKVSVIAGNTINPEIDILQISRTSENLISENLYRLIGYKVKLMKLDEGSKGLCWDAFYNGIGESLLCLNNGVNHVVLILGCHESVPSDEMFEAFRRWLWEKRELLNLILGNYISIAVYPHKRGRISPDIKGKSDFHPQDDETRLLSQALLHREFTFNKKLKCE